MWHELQLLGLPRKRLKAVSQALFSMGCAGVQEDHLPGEAPPPQQPWDTAPPPPPTERLVLRAWFEDADRGGIDEALSHLGVESVWAMVEEEDWANAWRAHFAPVRISDTLTIAPPWDAPEGSLVIEPGQGFGTGQHPTTRQVLPLLEPVARPGTTCLDVGCGSGVLALAAARLGLIAHGIDVEPEAIRDAERNAERNELVATFATTPIQELSEPAQLVLANLHGELVVALADDLIRLCAGDLLVAGVLDDREAMVRKALAPLALIERIQDDRWVALHYQAPAAP